jgi:hypothetical protein
LPKIKHFVDQWRVKKRSFGKKLAANQTHAMLNSLKNSYNNDAYPVLEAGENKFSQCKRPLLILFLLVWLVLVAGVFNLPANQTENTATQNNLSKPLPAAPPGNKKAMDRSPSAKLAYKGDEEYLSLNRYERFSEGTKKPVRRNRQKVRDTVAPGEKPLTLGGRGFDFKGRQLQARTGSFVDFTHRLKKPMPKMEPVQEDSLDLRFIQTKSRKDLIFHPVRRALGKYNRQKIYLKDEKPEKKNPQVLEDISETKLLLMEADNSLLILRRSRESLDLLGGNEKVNREKYNRW